METPGKHNLIPGQFLQGPSTCENLLDFTLETNSTRARLGFRAKICEALQTKTGEAELKSLQALYGALGRAEKDFDEAKSSALKWLYGCGSKTCTKNGILVKGNMDQNLRSPGGCILTPGGFVLVSRAFAKNSSRAKNHNEKKRGGRFGRILLKGFLGPISAEMLILK